MSVASLDTAYISFTVVAGLSTLFIGLFYLHMIWTQTQCASGNAYGRGALLVIGILAFLSMTIESSASLQDIGIKLRVSDGVEVSYLRWGFNVLLNPLLAIAICYFDNRKIVGGLYYVTFTMFAYSSFLMGVLSTGDARFYWWGVGVALVLVSFLSGLVTKKRGTWWALLSITAFIGLELLDAFVLLLERPYLHKMGSSVAEYIYGTRNFVAIFLFTVGLSMIYNGTKDEHSE